MPTIIPNIYTIAIAILIIYHIFLKWKLLKEKEIPSILQKFKANKFSEDGQRTEVIK